MYQESETTQLRIVAIGIDVKIGCAKMMQITCKTNRDIRRVLCRISRHILLEDSLHVTEEIISVSFQTVIASGQRRFTLCYHRLCGTYLMDRESVCLQRWLHTLLYHLNTPTEVARDRLVFRDASLNNVLQQTR